MQTLKIKYSEALENYLQQQVVLEYEFKATLNPLFAWESISCSLIYNQDIEEWARDYLLKVSSRLLNRASGKEKSKNIPSQIQKALYLTKKGRGSFFNDYEKAKGNLSIAVLVHCLIKEGETLRQASEYISKASYIANGQPQTEEECDKKYEITTSSPPSQKYLDSFPRSIGPLNRTAIEKIYNSYPDPEKSFPDSLD